MKPVGSGKVEGWQQPAKISLGLLPSGPDPVGEHNACHQPPGRDMWEGRENCKWGETGGNVFRPRGSWQSEWLPDFPP